MAVVHGLSSSRAAGSTSPSTRRLAGSDQSLHPWAAVGLDPDQHLVGLGVAGGWSATSARRDSIPATPPGSRRRASRRPVSYTHLRAHETRHDLVCRLL